MFPLWNPRTPTSVSMQRTMYANERLMRGHCIKNCQKNCKSRGENTMNDTVNRQILLVEKPTGKLGPSTSSCPRGYPRAEGWRGAGAHALYFT